MFGLVKESRLIKLQKEYDELRLRLDGCREIEGKNKWLQDEINKLSNKIRDIENKVREQTEADLFFISAKIQKKLLDGEPKKNTQQLSLEQSVLQQQLALGQQQSYNPFYALGGISNIFGK